MSEKQKMAESHMRGKEKEKMAKGQEKEKKKIRPKAYQKK